MKNMKKPKKLITVNRRLVGLKLGLINRINLSIAARLLAKRRWQLAKKLKAVRSSR
jgi:hypothetical protein